MYQQILAKNNANCSFELGYFSFDLQIFMCEQGAGSRGATKGFQLNHYLAMSLTKFNPKLQAFKHVMTLTCKLEGGLKGVGLFISLTSFQILAI